MARSSAVSADTRPGGLREHKKQATRAAIHQSALKLAAARGLDGVTVEQICEAAEISQRTFFNYFPSKVAAVLGMTIQPITDADRQWCLGRDQDLIADLCEMFGGHVEPSSDDAGLKRLAVCQPGLLGDVGRQMDQLRSDLVELAARRTGEDHRSRLAVSVVTAALAFTLQSEQAPEGAEALTAALRGVVCEIGELVGGTD